jgi:hypothetical protein
MGEAARVLDRRAYEETIVLPRAVRFPVELVPPEGFDEERPETWPTVSYHPQSGWLDEGPPRGPTIRMKAPLGPCDRSEGPLGARG